MRGLNRALKHVAASPKRNLRLHAATIRVKHVAQSATLRRLSHRR